MTHDHLYSECAHTLIWHESVRLLPLYHHAYVNAQIFPEGLVLVITTRVEVLLGKISLESSRICHVGLCLWPLKVKDRIESSATGKKLSHCSTGSLTEAKASLTDSHKIPLNLSTCELPVG